MCTHISVSPIPASPEGTGRSAVLPFLVFLFFSTLMAELTEASDGSEPGTLHGKVLSEGGLEIERAKITAIQIDKVQINAVPGDSPEGAFQEGSKAEVSVFSDSRGRFQLDRFQLDRCPLPCLLVIEHPRFEHRSVELSEIPAEGLTVTLHAKQAVFEQIDVTASRGSSDTLTPLSIASTAVQPENLAAAPTTLTELVEHAAGVAENGQGGLFQVFSIRGVSGHRVSTLVDGMRITSERRAGVSTSFIDPLLMGSVEVLRGPASTYYGSGALGGVIQVFPRISDGLWVESGYDSFGDQSVHAVGWGTDQSHGDGWSLGLAHRAMDDDQAADGTELNSEFSQVSAILRRAWSHGERRYQILAIPTYGADIGKPNTDFPQRITDYPRERHLLLKAAIDTPDWRFQAFLHPNDLETEVLDTGESLSEVFNSGVDLGADWQRDWALGSQGGAAGRFGFSYFGRRGVRAEERASDLAGNPLSEALTLDDGTQDELATFGSLRWSWGAATLQAGTRLTWQHQSNEARPSRDDSAWTGFLGVVRPVGKGIELTANLGSGLRFPTLSERFFIGTTGRGQVIGNPDLEAERSVDLDLGIRWFTSSLFLSFQVFQQDIDNYIERISLDDGTRTFVNLRSGTIRGIELEGFYVWSDHWTLSWNGHQLDGEDESGLPLSDVPADRLQIGLSYQRGQWTGRGQLQLRAAKDDPGSGEIAIPSAQLLSLSLKYHLTNGMALTLRGKNLLDEKYLNSADDKATIAPGRSLGLSLSWTAP